MVSIIRLYGIVEYVQIGFCIGLRFFLEEVLQSKPCSCHLFLSSGLENLALSQPPKMQWSLATGNEIAQTISQHYFRIKTNDENGVGCEKCFPVGI